MKIDIIGSANRRAAGTAASALRMKGVAWRDLSVHGPRRGAEREIEMRVAVVVGNPKPQSRTREAAILLARKLTGQEPDLVLDLIELGPALLEFGNPAVAEAIRAVQGAELIIFASPTYKATYTGLLKLFLDQVPPNGLLGITAVPLMLGAGPDHALAPELLLKPVLVELGATCPVPGLYLIDKSFAEDPRLDAWLARAQACLPLRSARKIA